jgi:hypothetical protein
VLWPPATSGGGGTAPTPFSLADGFSLSFCGDLGINISAVLGLACLPLPTIGYRAVWISGADGGGGDGGGSAGGGSRDRVQVGGHVAAKDPGHDGTDNGGRIVISLTEIGSLPAIEWVLNIFVDLQRLKTLLMDTLRITMAIERTAPPRSLSPTDERRAAGAAEWQFCTSVQVRLAPLISPFFAGILKRWLGFTIPVAWFHLKSGSVLHDLTRALHSDLTALAGSSSPGVPVPAGTPPAPAAWSR